MSPAPIEPPRKCTVSKIWRRAGCASASQTASSASSFSFGSTLGKGQGERFDLGQLQVVEQGAHRLPQGHDLGGLVRDVGRLLVAPLKELDEVRALRAQIAGAKE